MDKIVTECGDCKRVMKIKGFMRCVGWTDPGHNWRNGDCEYYTTEEVPAKLKDNQYSRLLANVRKRKDYRKYVKEVKNG